MLAAHRLNQALLPFFSVVSVASRLLHRWLPFFCSPQRLPPSSFFISAPLLPPKQLCVLMSDTGFRRVVVGGGLEGSCVLSSETKCYGVASHRGERPHRLGTPNQARQPIRSGSKKILHNTRQQTDLYSGLPYTESTGQLT